MCRIEYCLEQEARLSFSSGEGPYGLIVCPSRELAKQICETIEHFTACLKFKGLPSLRTCLTISGMSSNDSMDSRSGERVEGRARGPPPP